MATAKKTTRTKKGTEDQVQNETQEAKPLAPPTWRDRIPEDCIALNFEALEKDGRDPYKITEEEKANLDDKYKVILLKGFVEVSKMHGFASCETKAHYETRQEGSYSKSSAIAHCTILWRDPDHGKETLITEPGEASWNNTKGFGKEYLIRMARNRAFIANVRFHLGIHILGFDELGGDHENGGTHPQTLDVENPHLATFVENLVTSAGSSLEEIKAKVRNEDGTYKQGFGEFEYVKSFSDIDAANLVKIGKKYI